MGLSLKKIGKGLKKVAKGAGKVIGKVASTVAPVLPPGLKQLAAVGGSVLQGKNMQSHLGALAGSVLPGLGGKIAGKIPGLGGIIQGINGRVPLPGGIGGLLPKLPSLGSFGPMDGDGAGSGGLDLGKLAQMAGLALPGALGVASSMKDSRRMGDLTDRQVGIADEQLAHARELRDSARPLRATATARLLDRVNQGPRDLSHLQDTSNPFRKKYLPRMAPPPMGGGGA
jgi:hypothetical protein